MTKQKKVEIFDFNISLGTDSYPSSNNEDEWCLTIKKEFQKPNIRISLKGNPLLDDFKRSVKVLEAQNVVCQLKKFIKTLEVELNLDDEC